MATEKKRKHVVPSIGSEIAILAAAQHSTKLKQLKAGFIYLTLLQMYMYMYMYTYNVHVHIAVYTCTCIIVMHVHVYTVHEQLTRQQTKQHNTTQHNDTRDNNLFSKKKLPQVGLEPTTLYVHVRYVRPNHVHEDVPDHHHGSLMISPCRVECLKEIAM